MVIGFEKGMGRGTKSNSQVNRVDDCPAHWFYTQELGHPQSSLFQELLAGNEETGNDFKISLEESYSGIRWHNFLMIQHRG